ncbi:hypothetical protein IHN63_03165 [Deinococcus sp. 6YEL10]|uniref:hypothetical protein n=1 Tax=Deinococcus sp. 6YEL10 TaxID=2745870 RepID=UPI001E4FEA18|nr:hypothetical protein [Deinococcus sp. 6YEL10]MCD0160300.1 hypothetical protein [Deinococcus sp. 6YEL10]
MTGETLAEALAAMDACGPDLTSPEGVAAQARVIQAARAAAPVLTQQAATIQQLAGIADQNRERYETAEAAQGGAVIIVRTLQSALAAATVVEGLVADPRWQGSDAERAAVQDAHQRQLNRANLWFDKLRADAAASNIPAWNARGCQ